MFIKTQSFLILGVSKSGYSAGKFLLESGAKVFFFEELQSDKISDAKNKLTEMGGVEVEKENIDSILDEIDIVVISPGVPINHFVAVKAKEKNKKIMGELELGFFQFYPPLIAVTGTNGKTTTCTMISEILKSAKLDYQLVGNIGVPITSKIENINFDTLCVAEVSSFQLESISLFTPHIACVLNITPDHLERHYTMENYIFLKRRILTNQRESEYSVLNYDDQTVRSFSENLKSKIVYVSVKEKVDGGYLENGKLYFKDDYILDENELPVSGLHNVYNALFAISCAKICKVDNEIIRKSLIGFSGIPHRIELIAEKDGVKYFNDSKATNTASTINAIKTMNNPTVLILGGSEKGEDYDGLFVSIKQSNVKHVVITGASYLNMISSANNVGYNDITLTKDFDFAVKIASFIAKNGDNVLLSPACASFDNFENYEMRGKHFKEVVDSL